MLELYFNNGERLEVIPGTQLEIEQENPFLQFNDEIKGDITMPFEVKASPPNLKNLDWAGLLQQRIQNPGIPVQVFDNGLQHSTGKVMIERAVINRGRTSDGTISCFYLSGAASFYQDIKDVLLTQVDFGGNRTWPQPLVLDITETGTFWHHIHQVLHGAPGAFDYAFFPVSNHAWAGDGVQADQMNKLTFSGGVVQFDKFTFDQSDANVIVPFPYLHYVLQKAVQHVGWTIEGDALDDPDFRKITMVNFFGVDWARFLPHYAQVFGAIIAKSTVTINLQNHMPRWSVADFLIQLKNRFGWWYDFDRKNKVIRVRDLENVVSTGTKDFTAKAAITIPKKIEKAGKVYALKNQWTGTDGGGAPQLDKINYQGEKPTFADFPTPTQDRVGQAYLCLDENQFLMCYETASSVYEWQPYAQNMYDIEPEGANEEITTKVTPVGQQYAPSYGHLVPRIDMAGVWIERNDCSAEWGVHLTFYHGWAMTDLGRQYPLASNHIYDRQGNQVGNWSICFSAKRTDGVDVGLYPRKFQRVLESVRHPEGFDVTFNLSRPEFFALQFSDNILVDGVKLFLTKMKSTVPYDGAVLCEAIRVL